MLLGIVPPTVLKDTRYDEKEFDADEKLLGKAGPDKKLLSMSMATKLDSSSNTSGIVDERKLLKTAKRRIKVNALISSGSDPSKLLPAICK